MNNRDEQTITMCFGSRRKDEVDATRSRELDKIIKADEKRMAKEVKLLLLGTYPFRCQPSNIRLHVIPLELRTLINLSLTAGAGESGKSTVLKQMKLIYATGFSKTEKLEWKPVVFNNIVQSFRMIHDAMKELDISFEKAESEVRDLMGAIPFLTCYSIPSSVLNID